MTVIQLLRRARRLLMSDTSEPTAQEGADGLAAFQAMLWTLPALGMGDPGLTPVLLTDDTAYEAGEDELITYTGTNPDGAPITLPTTITSEQGCTIDPRAPRNGARVQIAGGSQYLYVITRGAWVDLSGLAVNDDSPLGPEHDEGLAAMLAVRIADEYDAQPKAATVAMAARAERDLHVRFRKRKTVWAEPALLRTGRQSFGAGYLSS